ncbi:hypothetical protein BJX99DRAFT_239683 [Aspergillus californicus]
MSTLNEEYAELMSWNNTGTFLYVPQRFSKFHPGSIGYFDKQGGWNEITDLSQEGGSQNSSFTSLSTALNREEPTESLWKTRSSGSEAELSFNLSAGLSGAMTAAPVDVSGQAKNKSSSTGKAALITESVVKYEKFKAPFQTPIQAWVKENARALVQSDYSAEIREFGLWAIQATWVTQECAITMTSGKSRDTNVGLDVGVTGIGKAGAGAGSIAKSNNEGWTTYQATESDKGLVVSFTGAKFQLRPFQKWRSVPLKQVRTEKLTDDEYSRAILDDEGNVIRVEYYRPIYDSTGKRIGEEKIDKEAEKKKREEEEKKKEEEAFISAEEFDIEFDSVGMSESDIQVEMDSLQAEKEREESQRKEREEAQQIERERRKAEILAIPDDAQRNAELREFYLQTVTTETVVYRT